MKRYIVEFQHGLDEPEYFVCQADDITHAVEQMMNAYPHAVFITIFKEEDQ